MPDLPDHVVRWAAPPSLNSLTENGLKKSAGEHLIFCYSGRTEELSTGNRFMRNYFLSSAMATCLCGAFGAAAATVDPNFTQSTVANVGANVTGLAWAPDGSSRLFVTRKAGAIQIIKNGALLPAPFATVSPLQTTSECGLIGICFDPNFINNGYVYVFATVSTTEQQIIRYTAVGDAGNSKTVLVQGLPTLGANHDGGAVGIGPDGKLYWAVGDNGNGTGVNNDMSSLASKIGRANLDGTVPSDNPFADGPGGANDYIWARGFRNPFTLTFQPQTGALWVNCVGTSYEQVFVVNARDHAGWNGYENNQPNGFIKPKIKYRTNGTDSPPIAAGNGATRSGNIATFRTTVAHGFRQGETITIGGVLDASFNGAFYVLSVPLSNTFNLSQNGPDAVSGGGTATTMNQGGCVTGGCFYDSTGVPPAYRGNFFYGDYNSGRIMRARLGSSADEITAVDYFVTGIANQIDITVGPDGALYYASHGGAVYRLAYNFSAQQLIITPTVVRMVEGGAAALTVRLATAPTGNVQVNVARNSGDNDIRVALGETLTFSPANWAVPQAVRLQALHDGDSTGDAATFTISATGLGPETVTVHALDLPIGAFSVGPVTHEPGAGFGLIRVGLNGQPGSTYVLEGNTNLRNSWTAISTNTLTGPSTNITDYESTNRLLRFYRARLLP
jgi:glucose/arabinose dehydrogenase